MKHIHMFIFNNKTEDHPLISRLIFSNIIKNFNVYVTKTQAINQLNFLRNAKANRIEFY